MSEAVMSGTHFMLGNIASAEGAIAAGCRFFGGYPITPSSEIAERMSSRLPYIGGSYIQMEDELASIAAILGASNAGAKSMTATSGPGLSLMLENIGLGFMTETPCVIVNVQRGGPSTGMPTLTSQADMMQARWGSHGDYEMIAYVPSSVQEMFDFTVKAFNAAARYRTPVIVLADQVIGHMSGKVVIPPADEIEVVSVKRPKSKPGENGFLPFDCTESVPAMALAGDGYNIHVTGLTHDERGYPNINVPSQTKLMDRLIGKIRNHVDEIAEVETRLLDDADIAVLCYGSTARSAWRAIQIAREEGIKVGLFRLMTAWPFPEKQVLDLSQQVKAILVPEVNYGQMVHPTREHANCPVYSLPHPGGAMITPEQILLSIQNIAHGNAP